MGQATRTTTLPLDLVPRQAGGANLGKRQALEDTVRLLEQARASAVAFFLAHPAKVTERVKVVSAQTGEVELRLLSADKLLTWTEAQTLQTPDHPEPLSAWNFSQRFPAMPYQYRRSVIKDAIGKVRGYLSHLAKWQQADKRKGKPGLPGDADPPTLYQGTLQLELEGAEPLSERFVRLKVYAEGVWTWVHYPVTLSRYFQLRLADPAWETQSPTLVLRPKQAALHFS